MDDPNITMEEYIMLEEEKARKRGKVFNWETAKYGKIWYDEDILDLRSVETEFPAIVFNDNLTSNEIPSCEPTISSLNDEINFRISFDESDNEDYTVVFNKNSFSYKTISTNDLKTDSENDNEKVNKPLFPLPEPTVSCIDDLDFFKEFENEFPAIVYNDALTSKSNFSTEPTLCPQHIDEFNFKEETSLSKYDEEEQNIFGMLFNLIKNLYVPFGIPFNPKRYYKDGDCARMLLRSRAIRHMTLPPRDQRHSISNLRDCSILISTDISKITRKQSKTSTRIRRVQKEAKESKPEAKPEKSSPQSNPVNNGQQKSTTTRQNLTTIQFQSLNNGESTKKRGFCTKSSHRTSTNITSWIASLAIHVNPKDDQTATNHSQMIGKIEGGD
ncbi:hypothetical protein Tco_0601374 [Tanacetum coccineum]